MIAMFKDKDAGRKCTPKDGIDYVAKLKTALVNDYCTVNNIDALEKLSARYVWRH